MNKWRPIEKEELEQIIREDLEACTPEQRAVFEQYRVPLRRAPIERYGKVEHVFIVAQRDKSPLLARGNGIRSPLPSNRSRSWLSALASHGILFSMEKDPGNGSPMGSFLS